MKNARGLGLEGPNVESRDLSVGSRKDSVRVLVPVGMLGAGFPEEELKTGIALGADVLAVDAGSTDSGPHYLGASIPKTARAAVLRDMRLILRHARAAGIPVLVGSCGTSGTDSGVDWVDEICRQVSDEEGLPLRIARIYSEQDKKALRRSIADARAIALPPAGPLTAAMIDSCEHIVGLMGHEPLVEALAAGADVVLAGRCTDTALIAAVPLMRGMPMGASWHAGKIAECGGLCTTGNGWGGVLVTIDRFGFDVEPLDVSVACTPTSVAAHMLYENADPFRMREPAGWLDVTEATYTALDDRRVRVEGSNFDVASQYSIKLEGAAAVGYQTVSIVGIRDASVLARIGDWTDSLEAFLAERIPIVLGLPPTSYEIALRAYGHNAVLGDLDTDGRVPREVGVVFCATAGDQETATAIAKFANPYLLHHALPDMTHMPSWSFSFSPAEIERGRVYSFVLNHALEVESPGELFRLDLADLER